MTDEESFIVLEETPSMLQFSLLDSSMSNTSIKKDDSNETIPSILQGVNRTEPPTKISNPTNGAVFEFDSPLSSLSSIKNSMDVYTGKPLKTTLAQSFLLGDINCDKIKVISTTTFSQSFINDFDCSFIFSLSMNRCG